MSSLRLSLFENVECPPNGGDRLPTSNASTLHRGTALHLVWPVTHRRGSSCRRRVRRACDVDRLPSRRNRRGCSASGWACGHRQGAQGGGCAAGAFQRGVLPQHMAEGLHSRHQRVALAGELYGGEWGGLGGLGPGVGGWAALCCPASTQPALGCAAALRRLPPTGRRAPPGSRGGPAGLGPTSMSTSLSSAQGGSDRWCLKAIEVPGFSDTMATMLQPARGSEHD